MGKKRFTAEDIRKMREEMFYECPECKYHIKPAETIRTDWDHVLCPNCNKEVWYDTTKAKRTS